MSIDIELYGIARRRAGRPVVTIPTNGPVLLATVLAYLAAEYPELATECFEGNGLKDGYVISVNGERFVRDPSVALNKDSSLLLMSSDAGG